MNSVSSLPQGYNEVFSINLQKDKKLSLIINGLALLIGVLMAVFANAFIPIGTLFSFENGFVAYILRFSVLLLSLVAYIVLHELVHAIAMKICGTKKVKFGFTGLYAFAGSNDFYYKKPYIFIALAPIIMLGAVLIIINIFVPIQWFWVVFILQICNVSGAAGDMYVTFKFIKQKDDILIKDTGVAMTVYSKQEETK